MAGATAIRTDGAPKALGPYSQGVDAGDYVFVSGTAGIDPATGKAPEDIAGQAEQAFENVGAILRAAGCDWKDVVKVTLWLTKPEYYDVVNGIYARFVAEPLPARSAPIVAAMPRGFLMAVEAIAKRA